MASLVEICSLALSHLGSSPIIGFPPVDNSPKAVLCAASYPFNRDAALRAYPWNCAKYRAALSPDIVYSPWVTGHSYSVGDIVSVVECVYRCLISHTSGVFATDLSNGKWERITPFGYTYQYSLPTDPWCLWVPKILNEELDYSVEGRKLLSNEATVEIVYIRRIIDTNLFDSLLAEVIAARLAHSLAYSITGVQSNTQLMWELYNRKLDEARMIDGMEGTVEAYSSNALIEVR